MNKRIKELALEAFQPINDITTEGVADRRTFDQAWFRHYNEKFAELIVQECAGVGYDASYYECALNVSNKIKQHFGIEE